MIDNLVVFVITGRFALRKVVMGHRNIGTKLLFLFTKERKKERKKARKKERKQEKMKERKEDRKEDRNKPTIKKGKTEKGRKK